MTVCDPDGMALEIELAGGPADGIRVVIEGDLMDPPSTYELLQSPTWRELEHADPDAPVEPWRLIYRRAVNPLDDGPAWVYHFEE